MMPITLEVIAASVEDAIAADAGGAGRLELLSDLTGGGVTPSYGLIHAVRRATRLPIFVMIRARPGSFLYSPAEVAQMAEDARIARELGADGIVGVSARDVVTGLQQSITVTATSGLTEEEMKRILEERGDEMLEKKQTSQEFELRRDRVAIALAEIDGLRPAVQEALVRTRFGKDEVQKAEGVLTRVRQAIEARDPRALAEQEESLERTLQLFKGLAGTGRGPGAG
jgi:molecular chaperone DnaK